MLLIIIPLTRIADSESVTLDAAHKPHPAAIEAFTAVEHTIKHAIKKSRLDWDKHEPRMWARVSGVTNEDLVSFDISSDLVEVRSGATSYGQIIFGKIRIPAVEDGYVHVRIHHSPHEPEDKVKFHSIRTEESIWTAVLPNTFPLDFFNE